MDGADSCFFEFSQSLKEEQLYVIRMSALLSLFFYRGSQSKLQLAGGGVSKGQGQNTRQPQVTGRSDGDNSLNQFRCFASSRCSLHDEGGVEIIANSVPCRLID